VPLILWPSHSRGATTPGGVEAGTIEIPSHPRVRHSPVQVICREA
jgi:hypothetical protein